MPSDKEKDASLENLEVGKPPKKGSVGKKILVGAACVAGIVAIRSTGTDDRYPLRVEYELAKACIDGGYARFSRELYLAKQEQCLCMLERTTKRVNYDEFKESKDQFFATFSKFSGECANKGRP